MQIKYSLLLLILVYVNDSTATIRNVPSPYSTIQVALNSCMNGDTVFVSPGTYFENILWPNIADIKLYSLGDSSNTIIDGNHLGRVLEFDSTILINSNTEIKGFKLRNGSIQGTQSYGAGIIISKCSPNFEMVSIESNHSHTMDLGFGGGVYLTRTNANFRHSSISRNSIDSSQWGYGGGVYMENSSPIFENVSIKNNSIRSTDWAYGNGVYCKNSNPTFINVNISENISDSDAYWYYGGGIYFQGGNITMTNVLISSNILGANGTHYSGAGIYYDGFSNDSIYTINFMNLTVANNHHQNPIKNVAGSGMYCEYCDSIQLNITNSIFYNTNNMPEFANTTGVSNITYSNIRGGFSGVGNIDLIPIFSSLTDYHLSGLSPCISSGTLVGAPSFDLDNNFRPSPTGSNPDMGCYESQFGNLVNISSIQIQEMNYFPNPVKDILNINFSPEDTKEINCQLFNLQGVELSTYTGQLTSQNNYSIKLNLSSLKSGIYILRIEQENKYRTLSIVKD